MRSSLRLRTNPNMPRRKDAVSTPQIRSCSVPRYGMRVFGVGVVIIIVIISSVCALNMASVSWQQSSAYTPETVQTRLYSLFNQDRNTYDVSPAMLDPQLSNRSYYRAMDVRDYGVTEDPYYTRENIYTVKKSEFGRSYYHSPEQIVDTWRNTGTRFRMNELNRDYTRVGIGVTEDNTNFYIVIRWE